MTKFQDKKSSVALLKQLKFKSIQILQNDVRNTTSVFSGQSWSLFQQKMGVTVIDQIVGKKKKKLEN